MESSKKDKKTSATEQQGRWDIDAVSGARQTDQLDKLKENASKDDLSSEDSPGTPPNIEVDNGSDSENQTSNRI